MHIHVHWNFIPCPFFLLQNRSYLLFIYMNWLSESPWYNQLIMYILTYLEGLMKITVGSQIYKIQNTWYKDMSSEAKGGTGRLHVLSFLLEEVQKYNDSKKAWSWICVVRNRTYYVLIIIYHKPIRLLLLDQRKIPLYCNSEGV